MMDAERRDVGLLGTSASIQKSVTELAKQKANDAIYTKRKSILKNSFESDQNVEIR